MIIGIDGNEANVRDLVGVSIYTLNLLVHFARLANDQTQFIVYVRHKPLPHLPKESTYFRYKIVRGPFLWSQIFLPLELMLHRHISVFFAPAHYLPRFCPVPCVVTIHDLAFLLYPAEFRKKDLYQLTRWTRYGVLKAKHIIAVSKTTKKDIMNWYQAPEHTVSIIYNGFESCTDLVGESSFQSYSLEPKKYILSLGTIQPRKNITTLIRAFEIFKSTVPSNIKLVIAGKKGWLTDHFEDAVAVSPYKKDILVTGYVSQKTQSDLYENAWVFVFPSRYEGFGIPLLEAMAHHCPVIASNAASLPEIGGEAALYFHPEQPQDLCEELIELKDSTALAAQLIERGNARVKEFSWEKCARETLAVIKSHAMT